MSCRVIVEPKGKHHLHGNLLEVRIDITVPGEEIALTREPNQHKEYRIALNEASTAPPEDGVPETVPG